MHLRPRASSDELVAMRESGLVAAVSSPPVDGRANAALCRLIARAAGVAPSRVAVVRGERSREKLVRVSGVEQAALERALARAIGSQQ